MPFIHQSPSLRRRHGSKLRAPSGACAMIATDRCCFAFLARAREQPLLALTQQRRLLLLLNPVEKYTPRLRTGFIMSSCRKIYDPGLRKIK